MPRILLAIGLTLGVLAASSARADEVLVLENGAVLKGAVIREDDVELTVQLTGTRKLALVTLDKEEVTKRFHSDPARPDVVVVPDVPEEAPEPPAVEPAAPHPEGAGSTPEIPEEPALQAEGFFERLARVAAMSLPADPAGRAMLAGLLLFALLSLVGIGSRLAEIETLTLPRAVLLATILGGLIVADVVFPHDLLRADRARWVLPAEGIAWLASAAIVLREGVGRAVLLFAFVLFSISVVVFTAGAILVTF